MFFKLYITCCFSDAGNYGHNNMVQPQWQSGVRESPNPAADAEAAQAAYVVYFDANGDAIMFYLHESHAFLATSVAVHLRVVAVHLVKMYLSLIF